MILDVFNPDLEILGLADWLAPLLSEVWANFRNKLVDEKRLEKRLLLREHPQSQGIYKLIVLQGPYLNLAGQIMPPFRFSKDP